MKLPRCRTLPLLSLLLTACAGESPASASSDAPPAIAAGQVARPASFDSGTCPLRPADFDQLTPYRWHVAQYKADRPLPFDGRIRIDFCELVGKDDKGQMRTGVMVNIARGAHAEALARHWHDVCRESLVPEARGTVQPVAGVPGGKRCAAANPSSSVYWIESPGRTVQLEPLTDDLAWTELLPKLLAAVARSRE